MMQRNSRSKRQRNIKFLKKPIMQANRLNRLLILLQVTRKKKQIMCTSIMKMELWEMQQKQKHTRLETMLKTRVIKYITKCSNKIPVVSRLKKVILIKGILRIKTRTIIQINQPEVKLEFT